ncbi:MAG: WG repeat-containing protein, partial [Candidatus Puniceispirillaceae bacterium]
NYDGYNPIGYFSEELAYVLKDNKFGFIDKTGKEIIDFVCSFGFKISWKIEKEMNLDILFSK